VWERIRTNEGCGCKGEAASEPFGKNLSTSNPLFLRNRLEKPSRLKNQSMVNKIFLNLAGKMRAGNMKAR